MRFNIGEQIGEYRVERFLGAGGMGEVYQGVHTKLGRAAAIKILGAAATDPSFKNRFFNEARLQATLHHPNVAALYDFQEINGQLCIFMEFVDGESLEDLVERRALTVEDAAKTFQSIVEAVHYIHKNAVIHRDIKAANVKISRDGTVKLLDFGIAKDAASHGLTHTGGIVGTPYYLAPEQLAGEAANPRTDVWALGILFYEMLTGGVPFKGDTLAELCHKITTAKFTPTEDLNPAVPRQIARIVNRCLKRNAAERYQTADELLHDLRRFAQSANETKTSSVATALGFLTRQAAVLPQSGAESQPPTNYQSQSGDQPQSNYQSQYSADASASGSNQLENQNYARPILARRSPLLLIAGMSAAAVVLLFVAVGIAAWVLSGNSKPLVSADNTITNGQPLKANQAVVVSSAALRKVKVDVDEGKAQVFLRGAPAGQTPLDFEARDGEKVDLTLKREGFQDKTVRLEISSGKQVYTFSLKQK